MPASTHPCSGVGAPFEILVAKGQRAWGILEGLEHWGFK